MKNKITVTIVTLLLCCLLVGCSHIDFYTTTKDVSPPANNTPQKVDVPEPLICETTVKSLLNQQVYRDDYLLISSDYVQVFPTWEGVTISKTGVVEQGIILELTPFISNSKNIRYTKTLTTEKSLTTTISNNIALKLSASVSIFDFGVEVGTHSSLSQTVKNITSGTYSVVYDIEKYSKLYEYKLVLVGDYEIHNYIHNGLNIICQPYVVSNYSFVTNITNTRIQLVAQKI